MSRGIRSIRRLRRLRRFPGGTQRPDLVMDRARHFDVMEKTCGEGGLSGHFDQEIVILDLDKIREGAEVGIQSAVPGLEVEVIPMPRADDL